MTGWAGLAHDGKVHAAKLPANAWDAIVGRERDAAGSGDASK